MHDHGKRKRPQQRMRNAVPKRKSPTKQSFWGIFQHDEKGKTYLPAFLASSSILPAYNLPM